MNHEYSGQYNVFGPPGTGKTRFLKKQAEKIVASRTLQKALDLTSVVKSLLSARRLHHAWKS